MHDESLDSASQIALPCRGSAVPTPIRPGKRAVSHKSEVRHHRLARQAALTALGYQDYPDYLRSPHWRRLRIRYMADQSLPQVCVCDETEIQLHHLTYERIGDELLTDLRPLCARCHALVHVLERRGEITLDLDGLFDKQRAAEYRPQLEAIADRRAADAQDDAAYLDSLSLVELINEAKRRGVDVTREKRVIAQRLRNIKRKLDAAQTRTRIAI